MIHHLSIPARDTRHVAADVGAEKARNLNWFRAFRMGAWVGFEPHDLRGS